MTDQELIERLEQDDWKTIPINTLAHPMDWLVIARHVKAGILKGSRLPSWCINARIQVLLVDSKVVTDEKFVQLLTGDNFWQGNK
jgi:hypothetical protein